MSRTAPPRLPAAAALAALTLAAVGCSSPQTERWLGSVTPYRVDVLQGNVVTQDLVARVKPGMSREQVRELLGSPLLTSAFHADRWDYIFTMRRQGVAPQRRSVVAYFKGETLERIETPELPTEQEFVGSIRPARSGSAPLPVLALTDEQRKALPPPTKGQATAAALPQGANRPYPPLEAQ